MVRDMVTASTGWSRRARLTKRVWIRHTIDESFSQSHALPLADIDGDGTPELITGKRYRGHSGARSRFIRPRRRLRIQAPEELDSTPQKSSAEGTRKPIETMRIATAAGDPLFTASRCRSTEQRAQARSSLQPISTTMAT